MIGALGAKYTRCGGEKGDQSLSDNFLRVLLVIQSFDFWQFGRKPKRPPVCMCNCQRALQLQHLLSCCPLNIELKDLLQELKMVRM